MDQTTITRTFSEQCTEWTFDAVNATREIVECETGITPIWFLLVIVFVLLTFIIAIIFD